MNLHVILAQEHANFLYCSSFSIFAADICTYSVCVCVCICHIQKYHICYATVYKMLGQTFAFSIDTFLVYIHLFLKLNHISSIILFRLFIGIFIPVRTLTAYFTFGHQMIQGSKLLLRDNDVYYYTKSKQKLKSLKCTSFCDILDSVPVYQPEKNPDGLLD